MVNGFFKSPKVQQQKTLPMSIIRSRSYQIAFHEELPWTFYHKPNEKNKDLNEVRLKNKCNLLLLF